MVASIALIQVKAPLHSDMTCDVSRYYNLAYYYIYLKLLLFDKMSQLAFLEYRDEKKNSHLILDPYPPDEIDKFIPTGSFLLHLYAWGSLASLYSPR